MAFSHHVAARETGCATLLPVLCTSATTSTWSRLWSANYHFICLKQACCYHRGAQICDWAEPGLKLWGPGCQVSWGGGGHTDTMQGQILRVISCELTYGPMNCDFAWGLTNE